MSELWGWVLQEADAGTEWGVQKVSQRVPRMTGQGGSCIWQGGHQTDAGATEAMPALWN